MNQPIRWRPVGATAWVNDDATLIDGIGGNLAIRTNKGFVSMDRNGSTKYESSMGHWEGNFRLDANLPIVRITPSVVTYVLEVSER